MKQISVLQYSFDANDATDLLYFAIEPFPKLKACQRRAVLEKGSKHLCPYLKY